MNTPTHTNEVLQSAVTAAISVRGAWDDSLFQVKAGASLGDALETASVLLDTVRGSFVGLAENLGVSHEAAYAWGAINTLDIATALVMASLEGLTEAEKGNRK